MSCLSKSHRINTLNAKGSVSLQREFNHIYKKGKKWHTHSFVVFYVKSDELKLGFIASKKVGNAVFRSKAKRKLRALVLEKEERLKNGKYIFVAKSEIFNKEHKVLQKDFNYAMKKLGLF
ncbi:MAG: ribonuclease P protein component [Campylobacterota bacterium]|nr:ribonuclease P protein component [Campylobacterota bacterium]